MLHVRAGETRSRRPLTMSTSHDAGSRRVKTGSIGINHYLLDPAAPFGGVKASGIGRELGPEGLTAYLQLQTIYATPPPQPAA